MFIDISNERFGKLIVIKYVGKNKYGSSEWLCLCDCGNYHIVTTSHLRGGHTKSCGCLSPGFSDSKIYGVWVSMVQRCTNPNDRAYKNYGGRGIKVCERLLKFENFYKDVGDPPTKNHQLDRINNDGNYCPENWKWSTRKEQNRNKSNNRMVPLNGKILCLKDYCEQFNIRYNTILGRILRGWSVNKALNTPIKKRRK